MYKAKIWHGQNIFIRNNICPLYLICFILNFIDMAAVRLIAIAGFVVVITLLEQTKPMEARRVKVVHIGPRVRKLVKKVDELKKEIASREQCERT